MKSLLIVWTSTTGGTEQMARAAAHGAREAGGVDVILEHASIATPAQLIAAHATIFATPEHLGSMAGPMKTFFDRAYYEAIEKVTGRAYAIMVCAGTDGTGTIRQIQRIATGLKLRAIAEPILVLTRAHLPVDILAHKTIAPDELKRCEELGGLMAAGLSTGMF